MHFAKGAGPGRKILGKCKDRSAVHQAVAGNHAVGRHLDLFHAEIHAAMADKHVDFPKRARIE